MSVGTRRFSALRVERSLLDLPYILDACVIPVPDLDKKQRCGAVIELHQREESLEPTVLDRLRSDLSNALDPYMLPTLLCIAGGDKKSITRTMTGKPIKSHMIKDYFGGVDEIPSKLIRSRLEQLHKSGKIQVWESTNFHVNV